MSLLFIDGFDHYNPITYPTLKQDNGWNSSTSYQSQTGGRFNKPCIVGISSTTSIMKKTLPNYYNALIVGFAINWAGTSSSMNLLNLYSDDTVYISLFKKSNSLIVTSGDTTIASWYDNTLSIDRQFYIELKTIIDSSNGLVQLRLSDYLAIDVTNVNTKNGTSSFLNKIGFCCGTDMTIKLDDVYICDLTGDTNNDFLGECRIDTIYPNNTGSYDKQKSSTGLNYQCVDDATYSDNTDYLYNDRLHFSDSQLYSSLSSDVTGNVYGIQMNMIAKKRASGTPINIKPLIRKNSTDYLQNEFQLTPEYKSSNTIVELDPVDSSYQTKTDFSDIEFGIQLFYEPTAPNYIFSAQEAIDVLSSEKFLNTHGLLAQYPIDLISENKSLNTHAHLSHSTLDILNKSFTLNTSACMSQQYIESISKSLNLNTIGYLSHIPIDIISSHDDTYMDAIGGTITYDGDFKIHTFTSSGDFTVTKIGIGYDYCNVVDCLIIAGGGGGGGCGSGGGAGGYIYQRDFTVYKQTYQLTIGNGGNGGVGAVNGTKGQDSTFSSLIAEGGGYGATHGGSAGGNGGSGGGGPVKTATPASTGGIGSQGNNGGAGGVDLNQYANSGGGGGAGTAGAAGGTVAGCGKGGDGLSCSITGISVIYAGGGGSGEVNGSNPGTGGTGGGGSGFTNAGGSNGVTNTGGGGGGGSFNNGTYYNGGTGGSGIIIIRYKHPVAFTGGLKSYPYRKSITLSRSSGAVIDYQMKLLVGQSSGSSGAAVNCDGRCLSNFNDLRFTTSDGTTILNYYIESISGTSPNKTATIQIKFDSIDTTATKFYMYWGNSNASSVSDGTNTFVFFDDFSNMNDQTVTSGTASTTTDGTLNVLSVSSTDTGDDIVTGNNFYGNEHSFMAKVKSDHYSSYSYHEIMLIQTAGVQHGVHIYFCHYLSDYYSKISFYNGSHHNVTNIGTNWAAGTYYIVDVRYFSSTDHKVYINNTLVASDTTTSISGNSQFYFGTRNANSQVRVDWVAVRKCLSTEPVWGNWSQLERAE